MSERFVSDIELPDQYYGVLVRSTVQRGHLVDLRAPKMPDGYHLYSATDIPGENRLTALGTSIPIFTPYEIQYFGEPVGILVGPDPQVVLDLVAEVMIETEPLEPYAFGEKFGASQVVGKRVTFSGDVESALASAPRVYEGTCETTPQDHYYPEPLGVVVSFQDGKLTVHTATQWPFHVRKTVSAVLDLDPEEIVVAPTAQAESLDGKLWFPSLIAAQASIAAVLSRRPVKLMFSRQEDFLFSVKSAPVIVRHRTALAADGSLDAMEVRILVNAGAYSPLIDEILDRMTVTATGCYAPRHWRIEAWALRTNLPPMGALTGWGEAQTFFAIENHLSSVIAEIGASPVEWKLLAACGKGRRTITGHEMKDDQRLAELFAAVCTQSDFPRKYSAYELLRRSADEGSARSAGHADDAGSASAGSAHGAGSTLAEPVLGNGPIRGIGIALGFQGNGFLGGTCPGSNYSVEVTMDTDGRVRIKSNLQSRTMEYRVRALAADLLALEPSLVSFTGADTSTMSDTGPDTLSVKVTVVSELVEKCCLSIQKLRFRQPLPISVKKTWKPAKGDAWDGAALKGKPFVSTTPGAAVVEIELDPLTYETRIRGIWVAADPGRLFDRHAAIGAVRKTITLSLSKLLAERVSIRDGRLAPRDGAQYDILPPSLVPDAEVTFLDSDASPRGVGSIAHNLVPAAFASALRQIARAPVRSIPIDPESVWQMMRGKDRP
jgi:CO/xanthine dehydrogenase Mo-binding subunit